MTKMNPEVKARWVAALRSGNYKQGMGELRSERDEFCCLGVLCDLHDSARWLPMEGGAAFIYEFNGADDYELPPKPLRDAWGFDWSSVLVEISGDRCYLYDHNDSGRSFAEIADAIEAQL